MKISEVKKLSPMDRLVYWIRERHNIYKRRRAGLLRPWTDDEVLQSYYFTNPYREHDKTTVWFRENVRDPLRNDPAVLFATICFRWFNFIPTGCLLADAGLLVDWDLQRAVDLLEGVKGQVFTGAFNVSNGGSTKSKIRRVCEDYLDPVFEDCEHIAARWQRGEGTLQAMHDNLSHFPGMGGSGFMAAQVVCDLKYTWMLDGVADWWTWCSVGPGSKRGLNLLHGRPTDALISKVVWQLELQELMTVITPKLPKMPRLHAQDLQNCLCEFSKYEKACEGGGSKRRYLGV